MWHGCVPRIRSIKHAWSRPRRRGRGWKRGSAHIARCRFNRRWRDSIRNTRGRSYGPRRRGKNAQSGLRSRGRGANARSIDACYRLRRRGKARKARPRSRRPGKAVADPERTATQYDQHDKETDFDKNTAEDPRKVEAAQGDPRKFEVAHIMSIGDGCTLYRPVGYRGRRDDLGLVGDGR